MQTIRKKQTQNLSGSKPAHRILIITYEILAIICLSEIIWVIQETSTQFLKLGQVWKLRRQGIRRNAYMATSLEIHACKHAEAIMA